MDPLLGLSLQHYANTAARRMKSPSLVGLLNQFAGIRKLSQDVNEYEGELGDDEMDKDDE